MEELVAVEVRTTEGNVCWFDLAQNKIVAMRTYPRGNAQCLACDPDGVHVLVGDDQSVLEHLSTFSAYLTRLKRVISNATNRSLVLLDELGSGTDPEEGAALAASVIEHFLEKGALLIVTTHLSSVKSFAMNDSRVINASMEFDGGHSTYRLIVGIPGRSRFWRESLITNQVERLMVNGSFTPATSR